MVIRNIQLRKAAEAKKAKLKAERDGAQPEGDGSKDPKYMTEAEIIQARMDAEAAGNQNMSEHQKQQELERLEREVYGRFWIREGYFNEKNQAKWLETAEDLKHINVQVLQDIEDHILLQGFKKEKPQKIKELIAGDHWERVLKVKSKMKVGGEEFQTEEEEKKKKRAFMNQFRPENKYWNFIEDCPEEQKVDHVLRYDANPVACYSDGRVEKILNSLVEIGMHIRSHEDTKWNLLRKRTMQIFEAQDTQEKAEAQA